jgi:hypothetical protein
MKWTNHMRTHCQPRFQMHIYWPAGWHFRAQWQMRLAAIERGMFWITIKWWMHIIFRATFTVRCLSFFIERWIILWERLLLMECCVIFKPNLTVPFSQVRLCCRLCAGEIHFTIIRMKIRSKIMFWWNERHIGNIRSGLIYLVESWMSGRHFERGVKPGSVGVD